MVDAPPPRNRFLEPFGSRAWHADGSPFSAADYRAAGLDVPTPEQQARWAELDEQLRRQESNSTT